MSQRREQPYVTKPSDALKARLEAAQQARLFIVQTPGPTSFVLKEEGKRTKLRVSIGSVHTCTCGERAQPCIHAAFVLLRVFRLSPTDPICWQSSLIDRELESLVEMRARDLARRRLEERDWGSAPTSTADPASPDRSGEVRRRPIDEEDGDPCPICYEDISEVDDEKGDLVWCRKACGKSCHRRCFGMWQEHQQSIGQKLTCPHLSLIHI